MEAGTSKETKLFHEIAAEQSGIGKSSFEIPDSLLRQIVTSLDPCAINNLIYHNIDWNKVESRLQLRKNIPRIDITTALDSDAHDDGASDGSRSNIGTPNYSLETKQYKSTPNRTTPYRIPPEDEQMDFAPGGFDQIQDKFNEKEKDTLVEEIVDLVRCIRKYNDSALASSSTWIDKENITKISEQIVILLSYLPGILHADEIVRAFLFENGPGILKAILTDCPELKIAFLNSLLKVHGHGKRNELRTEVIETIISLEPSLAETVIEKLSNNRLDSHFVCRIAINHLNDIDFVKFLEPLLTDRQSFLYLSILRSGGRKILPKIIDKLLKIVKNVLHAEPENMPEVAKAPWCTRLSYCLVELLGGSDPWRDDDMILITRFVFRTELSKNSEPIVAKSDVVISTDEFMETHSFLSLADLDDSIVPDSEDEALAPNQLHEPVRRVRSNTETRISSSPFGDAHETFVLASLVAVPLFTQFPPNQTAAVQPPDRAVDDWLDAARRRTFDLSRGSFGANLLYVHACIMCGRIDDLAKFASEILKRKVEISQRNMHAQVLKNTFLSRCLSEQEVANRSTEQAITPSFNENTIERSAIFSMTALQSAGVFRTFKINIADWLEKQLENVTYPASEILADLVEVFASNTANFKTPGLSLRFIEKTFENGMLNQNNLTQKLYVLMYLMTYREQHLRVEPSLKGMIYSEEMYTRLPIRYLLTVMETRHRDFENLRFRLIARCSNIIPYMMPTAQSMTLVSKMALSPQSPRKSIPFEFIEKASFESQMLAMPVVLDMFSKSLDGTASEEQEKTIVAMFILYDQICPALLYESAASSWLSHDSSILVEDLYKIPALLFRCDRRILNSPSHFECFIRTLNFFSMAVRADLRVKMMMSNNRVVPSSQHHKMSLEHERKEKEHLTFSFIDSQHSVVIHALIEVCDSKRMMDDERDFEMMEKRKKIVRIACEYIHRAFIDFGGLLKVIIFQKFPIHQIRMLVEGVPSLFAATAHLNEILSNTDPQRRIFGIVLASELCRKYRVRETLDTARMVCDIVHTLQKYGELPSSNKLWKHVVPAMISFATEFPSLTDCITRLLNRVLGNARNRLAVRYGLLAGDPRHEEYQLVETITKFLEGNEKRTKRNTSIMGS